MSLPWALITRRHFSFSFPYCALWWRLKRRAVTLKASEPGPTSDAGEAKLIPISPPSWKQSRADVRCFVRMQINTNIKGALLEAGLALMVWAKVHSPYFLLFISPGRALRTKPTELKRFIFYLGHFYEYKHVNVMGHRGRGNKTEIKHKSSREDLNMQKKAQNRNISYE